VDVRRACAAFGISACRVRSARHRSCFVLGMAARSTELITCYQRFVRRTVRRLGIAEADADDVTQKVLIIATSKLPQIAEGRERAFVRGCALRVAHNERRRSARRPVEQMNVDLFMSPGLPADELLDKGRERAQWALILRRLCDPLRAVFSLYEIEQLTMTEIAVRLGIPPGTVASRLRRARVQFSRELKLHLRRGRLGFVGSSTGVR
jgi:RNA polymerase sigma-70 factor (ECF subfamily)